MIRFIDLRGQILLDHDLPEDQQTSQFAFYNTVSDTFITMCGEQVWETFDEFRSCWMAAVDPPPLCRFYGLCPSWCFR